jgi:16S rRNA (adenine1518-N6/adenine1519-N6)-dimethyltransferase
VIDDLPPLREVVRRHELQARKALGQNFLFDLNLTARIARTSGAALDKACVIEIGPGPGGLTRALLAEGAGHVIAIERDARFYPVLAEIGAHYPGRLTVLQGDALRLDPRPAIPTGLKPRIVANLPYNVGTALIVGWLESEPWPPWFESITVMVQREVGERLVATPKQAKDYGRLSVLTGWRSQARIVFDVPASAFVPPPKVTSCVVHLVPQPQPEPIVRSSTLSQVTQAAFGQRRKMLRQSLKSLSPEPLALLDEAGIDPTARAETIDLDGFLRLSAQVEARRTA